jgi:hypothetical protein
MKRIHRSLLRSWSRSANTTRAFRSRQRSYSSGTGALKKWLALLSIDTSLDDEQIVMAYRRRWDIEVFFKMAKPFLILPKSARVGPMTLVSPMPRWCGCCRYIMLALAKRTNKGPRTLGTLFHACCEELLQATFAEALALMLMFLEQAMGAATELTREIIRSLIDRFLMDLPTIYGARCYLFECNLE